MTDPKTSPNGYVHDHDDLPALLEQLDPAACDYEEWWKIGAALKNSGFDADDWDSWSARDPDRYEPGECARKWKGFNDSIGAGTLVTICKNHGVDTSRHGGGSDGRATYTPVDITGFGGARAFGINDAVTFTLGADPNGRTATSTRKNDEKSGAPLAPAIEAARFDVTPEASKLAKICNEEPEDPAGECAMWVAALFEDGDRLCHLARKGDASFNPKKDKWNPSAAGHFDLTAGDVVNRLCAGETLEQVFGEPNPKAGAWCTINPCDGAGRGSDHTTTFRHLLVESDEMPLDETVAAIYALRLPVSALWYSGGKSIHAALRVDAANKEEYEERAGDAYSWLMAHGLKLDKQNSDCSRLCRIPGFVRFYKGEKHWQRLLKTGPLEGCCTSWTSWCAWRSEVDASTASTKGGRGSDVDVPARYEYFLDWKAGDGKELAAAERKAAEHPDAMGFEDVRRAYRRPRGSDENKWTDDHLGAAFALDESGRMQPWHDPATGRQPQDDADKWTFDRKAFAVWQRDAIRAAGGDLEDPARRRYEYVVVDRNGDALNSLDPDAFEGLELADVAGVIRRDATMPEGPWTSTDGQIWIEVDGQDGQYWESVPDAIGDPWDFGNEDLSAIKSGAVAVYAEGAKGEEDGGDPDGGDEATSTEGGAPRDYAGVGAIVWNDKELSRLFADRYRRVLCFNEDLGRSGGWMYYDGTRWAESQTQPYAAVKHFVDDLADRVSRMPDGKAHKAAVKNLKAYSSYNAAKHIVQYAACDMSVAASDFDSNPNLVNLENCTLDLETGEVHKHDAGDMITRLAGCAYDPDADGTAWRDFVRETCSTADGTPDPELENFVQSMMGNTLAADNSLNRAVIVKGPNRTGKGTFFDVLQDTFGDYAVGIEPRALAVTSQSNAGAPSPDLADLEGKRLAVGAEVPKGMYLDAALLKRLTGGDTIRARQLYGRLRGFVFTGTIWFNTNSLPNVTDQTVFKGNRVVVVPFEHHVPEEAQDFTLRDRLSTPEGRSAVMNWLIEGRKAGKSLRFELPERCKGLLDDYQTASDKIGLFIEDRCDLGPDYYQTGGELYVAWKKWCDDVNRNAGTNTSFYNDLEDHDGITRQKRECVAGKKCRNVFHGIRLKQQSNDDGRIN